MEKDLSGSMYICTYVLTCTYVCVGVNQSQVINDLKIICILATLQEYT